MRISIEQSLLQVLGVRVNKKVVEDVNKPE